MCICNCTYIQTKQKNAGILLLMRDVQIGTSTLADGEDNVCTIYMFYERRFNCIVYGLDVFLVC
jgi:hypothetical protein